MSIEVQPLALNVEQVKFPSMVLSEVMPERSSFEMVTELTMSIFSSGVPARLSSPSDTD